MIRMLIKWNSVILILDHEQECLSAVEYDILNVACKLTGLSWASG